MPDDGPCVFAKAVLAQAAGCPLAQRHSVGERELVVCTQAPAHGRCSALASMLQERARFALKLPTRVGAPLLHAQAMRLQCGGLQALAGHLSQTTQDVDALVNAAAQAQGGLLHLPWPTLVADVKAWQPRRRSAAADPKASP